MNRVVRSCLVFASIVAAAPGRAQDTVRVSVDSAGAEGDGPSFGSVRPATTGGEAALVVFDSRATDLVKKDTNGMRDIFLRDLAAGSTMRIVFDFTDGETDGDSLDASITPDGRFVVFTSNATDLVKGDKNGMQDVFVLDRTSGGVERVSVDSSGAEGDEASFDPMISDDGRWVAFTSAATNLVTNDGNARNDVFLRDRQTGATSCVSVDANGVHGNGSSDDPWLAADGRRVAFESAANDLVANDTNGHADIFVRDLVAGVTTRESMNQGGFELDRPSADPSLSADGALLAFQASASNLHRDVPTHSAQAYLRDLSTGEVWLASRGVDGQRAAGLVSLPTLMTDSAGEPIVTYWSGATNLPDDGNSDLDLFASKPWSGVTQCLSVDTNGVDTNFFPSATFRAGITPEGDAVCITTPLVGLDPNDANGTTDVFRRGLQWTQPEEFGSGLAGSGGFVPRLTGCGGSCEAGRWHVEIVDGMALAPGTLWVGLGRTSGIPLFGGTFYVDFTTLALAVPIVLGGTPGVPGTGTLHLDGVNVEDLGDLSHFLQCTFLDAGAPRRVSLSNALEIAIDA